MDRGFVFKQINNYMNCFVPGDPKVKKGSPAPTFNTFHPRLLKPS